MNHDPKQYEVNKAMAENDLKKLAQQHKPSMTSIDEVKSMFNSIKSKIDGFQMDFFSDQDLVAIVLGAWGLMGTTQELEVDYDIQTEVGA